MDVAILIVEMMHGICSAKGRKPLRKGTKPPCILYLQDARPGPGAQSSLLHMLSIRGPLALLKTALLVKACKGSARINSGDLAAKPIDRNNSFLVNNSRVSDQQ